MRFWKLFLYSTVIILMLSNFDSRRTDAQTEVATSPAPSLTLVWQSKFKGDAVLISRGDIGVDGSGNVYVSTQESNSIKKFDSDGNYVAQWGQGGKDAGNFSLSLGVAVDADNNVYVTDFNNKRIEKFDSSGKFLLQWPTEPSTSPAFIGVDGLGNVYVDEFPPHDNHFVQKFDPNGKLVGEWGKDSGLPGYRIEDIAVDKDGNTYIADPITHSVEKLDTNGKLVATFGGKPSEDGNGQFTDPFGISVDPQGNIYVLDSNFLQKLAPDGSFIAQWSTHGGDLDSAANVTVDKQGNIYVFAKSAVPAVNGGTVDAFVLKKFKQWQ